MCECTCLDFLRFLEEQLKEAVARAENAERDVVRNENIVAGVSNDIQYEQKKRSEVDKEIEKIDELVEGLASLDSFEPQPKPQAEEEEPEED